jgi:rubrerythrin
MNGAPVPPEFPNPTLDRRRLLRSGGLALSFGAIVAACGTNRNSNDDPGRVGSASTGATLPEAEVDDVALLRTAQSLEYTALDVYEAAVGLGVLDAAQTAAVERFVQDHIDHAGRIGQLITEAGGEEFTCANPFITNRVVTPLLEAITESTDQQRDVLNTAHALECLAAETYQALVGSLTSAELRKEMMLIGADENRHAATLAIAITGAPEAYTSPALVGEEVAPDSDGFPIPYAIPAQFGQLGGIDLVVGEPNEEGQRLTLTLQTPAENSYVYDYMSCDV